MSFSGVSRVFLRTLIHRTNISTSYSSRSYSRWTHRKPSKVFLPPNEGAITSLKKEKIIDLDPGIFNKSEGIKREGTVSNVDLQEDSSKNKKMPPIPDNVKEKREQKIKKNKSALNLHKVFDENDQIIYEKCKDNDGRISTLLVKLKSKKDRLRMGQILVEGWRLTVEGLEAKCRLNYLMFSRQEDLNNIRPFLPKVGVKVYKVPYKEMQMWSDVETPSGLFGVFEMPTPDNIKRSSRPFPMQIICDNIRVPGNLGAILRAAAGAGCDRLLLTKGCVDLWDSKVIRSASGAHFYLPVHTGMDWEEITDFVDNNSPVLIADSNTHGPENTEDAGSVQEPELSMPVLPYYSVDYPTMKFVTIIIGGETEGISEESYRFAKERNGVRINIPLQNGVDSLNTGMAAAVIAFEVKKQLLQAYTKAKLDRQTMYGT